MKKAPGALDPAEMTALLRAGVLAVDPASVGQSVETLPAVWGAMIEFGHPEVIASLVVLSDGSVSIYLDDGTGVIGCGLHPRVRLTAGKLLQVAQQMRPSCVAMKHHPLPQADTVTFYLLTHEGVMGAEALRSELDEGAVPLAELYYAAHGVIDIVELLGAGVNLVDEMRLIKAQVARGAYAAEQDSLAEHHIAQREAPTRGRVCRILPYAGNVARRSNS